MREVNIEQLAHEWREEGGREGERGRGGREERETGGREGGDTHDICIPVHDTRGHPTVLLLLGQT